jgi:ferredoxin
MIANYGYEDGSGFYYITIDTDVCLSCEAYACTKVCPSAVFAMEMDDYDDFVAVVAEAARKRLRELCSTCKAQNGSGGTERKLPCTEGCPGGALRHSW